MSSFVSLVVDRLSPTSPQNPIPIIYGKFTAPVRNDPQVHLLQSGGEPRPWRPPKWLPALCKTRPLRRNLDNCMGHGVWDPGIFGLRA